MVLAAIGWWRHSTPLALVGVAGILATVGLYLWQKHCLTGVTYRRRLVQQRAMFGERVGFEVELVNDKLLPLTWLQVEDEFPRGLELEGGTVVPRGSDLYHSYVQVVPMLPYQRIRRHLHVVCAVRGLHRIGPGRLTSGDPLGYRRHERRVPEQMELVVYPKIFVLEPPEIMSRVPLGLQRARAMPGDPTRVSGMRDYRPGDSLRHIDWRATARSTTIQVREFEPTASLQVAVFADLQPARTPRDVAGASRLEFTIAVAASVVSDLAERGTGVGLYTTGSVHGRAVSHPPTTAPSALVTMLEHLARVTPFGGPTFPGLLLGEGSGVRATTSLVVVTADFSEPVLVAMAELRRRLRITSLWIDDGIGSPPPPEMVDSWVRAEHSDDWSRRAVLELVA